MLVPAPYFVSPPTSPQFPVATKTHRCGGRQHPAIITVFSKVTQKRRPQGHFLLGSNCIVNWKLVVLLFCTYSVSEIMYIVIVCENHDDYGGDTKESRSSVTQWQYTTMPHVYSWGYLGWWWCQVIRSLLHQTGPAHRECAGECHSYFATLQCQTKSHNLIRKKSINFSKHSNDLSCDCDCLLLSSNIHAWL